MRRYRLSRFHPQPWPHLVAEVRALAESTPEYLPLSEVADSVANSPAAAALAGRLSLGAVTVTPTPVADPPDELLRVQVDTGGIVVWHQSLTGNDDRIHRPAAEAVPLFWRFVIEKFGIRPDPR